MKKFWLKSVLSVNDYLPWLLEIGVITAGTVESAEVPTTIFYRVHGKDRVDNSYAANLGKTVVDKFEDGKSFSIEHVFAFVYSLAG